MRGLLILLVIASQSTYAKYTDAFIVTIKDRYIEVTSPKERADVVSVIIQNETLDKIVSRLKSPKKVLKRFVVNSKGKEVLQVDMRNVNQLFYMPIAPPSQAVELRFGQGKYEVPEKK